MAILKHRYLDTTEYEAEDGNRCVARVAAKLWTRKARCLLLNESRRAEKRFELPFRLSSHTSPLLRTFFSVWHTR